MVEKTKENKGYKCISVKLDAYKKLKNIKSDYRIDNMTEALNFVIKNMKKVKIPK